MKIQSSSTEQGTYRVKIDVCSRFIDHDLQRMVSCGFSCSSNFISNFLFRLGSAFWRNFSNTFAAIISWVDLEKNSPNSKLVQMFRGFEYLSRKDPLGVANTDNSTQAYAQTDTCFFALTGVLFHDVSSRLLHSTDCQIITFQLNHAASYAFLIAALIGFLCHTPCQAHSHFIMSFEK